MRLVIVRHAEAAEGTPDELRRLTSRGREQARALGRRLREEGLEPDAIVSSPLLRARETAAARGLGEPQVDDRLAPGATPAGIRDAASAVVARASVTRASVARASVTRGGTVVVVGHQPDCGAAAAALTGGPEPAFPPCGHVLVELGPA
jgi:phosphohistidine phosphatase